MEERYLTHSAVETKALAKKIAEELAPGITVCLQGDLGTGKTTFAQGLLEALGATGPFTSPTFVIMKEYPLRRAVNGIKRIYHVDAYRVGEKDLRQLGFTDWCQDKEGIVILEWPERIEGLLPKNMWRMHFVWKSDTEREITIHRPWQTDTGSGRES